MGMSIYQALLLNTSVTNYYTLGSRFGILDGSLTAAVDNESLLFTKVPFLYNTSEVNCISYSCGFL